MHAQAHMRTYVCCMICLHHINAYVKTCMHAYIYISVHPYTTSSQTTLHYIQQQYHTLNNSTFHHISPHCITYPHAYTNYMYT